MKIELQIGTTKMLWKDLKEPTGSTVCLWYIGMEIEINSKANKRSDLSIRRKNFIYLGNLKNGDDGAVKFILTLKTNKRNKNIF